MAVLSFFERVDGRSGSMDQQFHRAYRREFLVELSDPSEFELDILLHPLCPKIYSSHPQDLLAVADKPEVTVPDPDAPQFRLVTVNYSTRSRDPDRENKDQNESPLGRPPEVVWGHTIGTRLFTVAADDTPVRLIRNGDDVGTANFKGEDNTKPRPVMNTAGAPYETVPDVEERRLTLTVMLPMAKFDPIVADSFVDTTNEKLWLKKFAPGTARCTQYSGKRDYGKMTPFWVVTLAFEFAKDWDVIVRDYGPFSLTTDGNYLVKRPVATDGGAVPWVNLNGDQGGALAPGESPYYLGFRRYPRKDYDALGLNNL